MKNQGILCLLLAACMFLAGIAGYFLGQCNDPSEVIVSRLPDPTTRPTTETVAATTAHGLIDINTADVIQLQSLPGIGPVLAQRIIDYRTENGPFTTVSELTMVEGIGLSTLEELMEFITVGGQT